MMCLTNEASVRKLTTQEICSYLDKCEYCTSTMYLHVKELSYRCIQSQKWTLNNNIKSDLAYTVATNIYMYLKDVNDPSFRIYKWYRFVYDKTYKTALAMHRSNIECPPQVFELNENCSYEEFISRYFNSAYDSIESIQKFELLESLKNSGNLIRSCVEFFVRYTEDFKNYQKIVDSVTWSILSGRYIYRDGLHSYEKQYIRILCRLTKHFLPMYIKSNILYMDSEFNTYVNTVSDFLKYGES